MGLIADLDFPHVVVASRRTPRVSSRARCARPATKHVPMNRDRVHSGIQRDTPLVPRAAAEQIVEETSRLVGKTLPPQWAGLLAQRAEVTYANGLRFRRRIQSRGDEGRDWLWAFMRHWVSALILKQRPELFRKLPSGYSVGRI
jgi:hypothetical protein